jgi:hypothetical protein
MGWVCGSHLRDERCIINQHHQHRPIRFPPDVLNHPNSEL